MNEIKVNLENLKDDEREQLLALIEKANKKPKKFKPEDGGIYWFVDSCGGVIHSPYCNCRMDLGRYNIDNCFETEEEAKFEAEKRKVIAELKNFALENNEEINWTSNNGKYFLSYQYGLDGLAVSAWYQSIKHQGIIYFSSYELCEQAIEKVGEDRIKRYLFGVEE